MPGSCRASPAHSATITGNRSQAATRRRATAHFTAGAAAAATAPGTPSISCASRGRHVGRGSPPAKDCGRGATRTRGELGVGRPYLDRDPPHVASIDGKEYAAKRGRSPVRKIANNEGASGAKSTASTQPPAHERKKTKRAIQTVPKAAGIAAHSSVRYSDAQY